MDIVLKTIGLTKRFGKRLAADNINLETYAGEVFGFLGPNGAGKTTTIKMILGLLHPDAGEIYINGVNTRTDFEEAMANIGGIVEGPEMYGYLSGLQNLQQYRRIREGVSRQRLDEVIRLVGLEKRIREKVKKYSLGMKQRLGVAHAIMHRPRLLILDEPTNGLDPAGIKQLRDIIKDLAHNQGVGVFVSSHQLAEMQLMCDRVGIISNGRLVDVRPVSNADDSLEDIFLGLTGGEGGQIE
jgi:ABC-2 type transport system ATP-binding protein